MYTNDTRLLARTLKSSLLLFFCVSGILLNVNMYISLYKDLLVVSLYIEHLLNTSTMYTTLINVFTNGDLYYYTI